MKILHVDDSSLALKLTKNHLTKAFPEVEQVTTLKPNEFLENYNDNTLLFHDLVLVDLIMPDISGENVIKLIRERYPKSFIICLSSNVQGLVQERVTSEGADLFIEKPPTYEKLLSVKEVYDARNGN